MKKLLLLISLSFFQVFPKNKHHYDIICAIRDSKLIKLTEILLKTQITKDEKNHYLDFAQKIYERRDKNLRCYGSCCITDGHLLPSESKITTISRFVLRSAGLGLCSWIVVGPFICSNEETFKSGFVVPVSIMMITTIILMITDPIDRSRISKKLHELLDNSFKIIDLIQDIEVSE